MTGKERGNSRDIQTAAYLHDYDPSTLARRSAGGGDAK